MDVERNEEPVTLEIPLESGRAILPMDNGVE